MRDRTLHPPARHPGYKTSVPRSPDQALLTVQQSLSEITGPTFGHATFGALDHDLVRNFSHGGDPVGERIILHGRVLDENRRPVPSTLVEIWQANASGRYRHKKDGYLGALDPNFGGCGRTLTDGNGYYFFHTIKPGPVPGRMGTTQAPHLSLWLVSRGINIGLNTGMYFPEDGDLHAADPILGSIEQRSRAGTLIARKTGPGHYRFDIRLQGEGETVYMDI